MKEFKKIMLYAAGVLAGIGLVCFLIAFCMGFTFERFGEMAHAGKFSISFNEEEFNWFGNKVSVDNGSSVIEQNCNHLDIKYDAGMLEVYYADVESIEIRRENVPGFSVSVSGTEGNQTLHIKGGIEIGINEGMDSKLIILVPKGVEFETIDMELGASQADIEGLAAEEIEIEIGAGQATISNMKAQSFEIGVGAGRVDATNLVAEDLDIETGVGEVNIGLNASECDYNYVIECGIGNVEVGEVSYSGFAANQNVVNADAAWKINVKCGVGQVRVFFACDNSDRDICEDPVHHHSDK